MTENNKIIIDADGAIFGRLCSFSAKKALQGFNVYIVNAEKAIITGDKKVIVGKFLNIRQKGKKHSLRGPRISKVSYKILKRGIRGMLPNHRYGIGKEALNRIMCYNSIPDSLKNQELTKLETQSKIKYITLGELSRIA